MPVVRSSILQGKTMSRGEQIEYIESEKTRALLGNSGSSETSEIHSSFVSVCLKLLNSWYKHSCQERDSMMYRSLWFIPFFHFHPIFLLISLFLYFLPSYLARNNANFTAILTLNILAGWTFIGWIIALVWALSSGRQQVAVPAQSTAPPQPAAAGTFFCSACGKPNAAGRSE